MDFNYVMPKYMKQNLNLFKSNFEDKNHFYSKEFIAGDKFYNPQLNKVQIAFEKAKSVFESNNGNIINLTHGGDLTVFRRNDFNNVF